jgi:flagellar basal-body rod protein FlgF
MDTGLYIAASGMMAQQVREDQLANDLSNSSTPGYKTDTSVQSDFGALLLANTSTGQPVGPINTGVRLGAPVTNLTPNSLHSTGQPLDFGIAGAGFFAVRTPQGVRYTRDGQFTTDAQGRLSTVTGFTVLGANGKPITISDPTSVTIAPDGTVTSNGKTAGRISVVSLTKAVKEGDTLFSGAAGARPQGTEVEQGYIEGSGVEPARAMVDMIVSLRAYESTQRVLHALDDTLGEATSRVGSANS